MVELLEPGTEAETCRMAGRGMNGLRGIIVCYNPHNSRYTLELEAGDMMCLRSRNVRAVRFKSEASDPSVAAVDDASVSREDAYRDTSGKVKSSLPNIPNRVEEERERGRDDEKAEPRQARQGRQGAPDLLESISPITVLPVALIAYMIFKNSGQGTHTPTYHSSNHHSGGITTPVLITSLVYTYFAWEWGTKPRSIDNRGDFKLSNVFLRLTFCEAWELALLGGLLLWCLEVEVYGIVSVGLVMFFVWKFGTKDGTRAFSFGNVKTSLSGLSIWEVLLVANVLESGLRHVTRRR
ncbi:hypothetical protein THAOC_29962 [Thalassiosira oceanica]|uniref:Uncharacterized protein n=1 Tax=Thalassiosira oceanica TaxID=159749 RepID=K0RW16_THAOC|nr:hypothetical protein THAOC_29962 [Thalassiosira oceanica]|eukprot:EJK50927.1 hypothetical protein THAOC_29962 [Thalassiosira oceanica]